jgi:hypothetical protein
MSDPHVSPALKHLRFGVSACAAVLGLALLSHVLIFALIHYTDVRQTRLEPPAHSDAPVVVVKHPKVGEGAADAAGQSKPGAGAVKTPTPAPEGEAADVNVVPSATALQLRGASAVIQTMGVCAALAMVVLVLQGVSIAAGASVPGVERAVTAASWCLLLGFLAIPWRGVMPELVYPGVFQAFETIAHDSDVLRGVVPGRVSGTAFFLMNLVLPVTMMAGVAAVALRFRGAIERGIIATHASQLEEQIEREIRERKLGELSTPRAVGALNKAIGLGAGAVEAPVVGAATRLHEGPVQVQPMSARSASTAEAPPNPNQPDARRRAF